MPLTDIVAAYQDITRRLEAKSNLQVQDERKKSCSHLTAYTSFVTPRASGCEEYEKEGTTELVGLRLCTVFGHGWM